ncbi:DgyrCDS7209 [Dimorphilus gyrociliatus]|uniref:DgyrCDS7209 n=1 Tax=Dimorphilus gyrociliatus TaxID=2664684 RepID=A0A7I8VQK5_9ANNE|nr:DgyrCDS7209 [Dimorphilus gyrociliatus]
MVDVQQIVVATGFSALTHPFAYAKVLIQLGYEPIPPVRSRSLLGKPVYSYPNIFRYMKYLAHEEGFLGLYRGFLPRASSTVLSNIITQCISSTPCFKRNTDRLTLGKHETKAQNDSFVILIKDTSKEMVARCTGVIISYPLQVIMIRSMAQFVGQETIYNSILNGFNEIYKNEGVAGFFEGLLSRLAGEVATLWACNIISHLAVKYLISQTEDPEKLSILISPIASVLVTNWTYPFILTANIMAVNNSGLAITKPPFGQSYDSWKSCWQHLTEIVS